MPLPSDIVPQSQQFTLPMGQIIEMVYVPAGQFLFGNSVESMGQSLFVPSFWLDRTEVTNSQFADFIVQTHAQWDGFAADLGNYPVTNINWYEAQSFCAWRGGRLPTEAEWEKGARGTDGRVYPWGNNMVCHAANVRETPHDWLTYYLFYGRQGALWYSCALDRDGFLDGPAPVGSFSPTGNSPYGAQDMMGNVWEWTASTYVNTPTLNTTDYHPQQPTAETPITVRGSSWYDSGDVRLFERGASIAAGHYDDLGFRCLTPIHP